MIISSEGIILKTTCSEDVELKRLLENYHDIGTCRKSEFIHLPCHRNTSSELKPGLI